MDIRELMDERRSWFGCWKEVDREIMVSVCSSSSPEMQCAEMQRPRRSLSKIKRRKCVLDVKVQE